MKNLININLKLIVSRMKKTGKSHGLALTLIGVKL